VHISEIRFSSWALIALAIVLLTAGLASAQSLPFVDFSPQAQPSPAQPQHTAAVAAGHDAGAGRALKQNVVTCSSNIGETHQLPGEHHGRCRAGAIDRRQRLPARENLGLRRQEHLGVGWLQRAVLCRAAARRGDQIEGARVRAERGFLLYTGEKGEIYFRLMTYARYLNQKGWTRAMWTFSVTPHGGAARGRAVAEVLCAVFRLVPDAENALLPLRLVLERLTGRPGAGRRRRQHQLRVQSLRDVRRGHHFVAVDTKHRGAVPVLARRGRSSDCGRVLPRLVHHRILVQG
jgi:hypothetical protein